MEKYWENQYNFHIDWSIRTMLRIGNTINAAVCSKFSERIIWHNLFFCPVHVKESFRTTIFSNDINVSKFVFELKGTKFHLSFKCAKLFTRENASIQLFDCDNAKTRYLCSLIKMPIKYNSCGNDLF